MSSSGSEKVVIKALLGNLFVTVMKFSGFAVTQSPSLFAEAVHSTADTFNQLLLLFGVRMSKSKGSFQFLFNLSSAMGLFVIGGLFTIYHAIHDFTDPAPINDNENLFYLGIGIIIVSFLIEGYTCLAAILEIYKRKGEESLIEFLKNSDDTTLVGIFLEDSAALIGLLLALTGMVLSRVTGSHYPDIISALMIGFMMSYIGILLIKNNSLLLVGKNLGTERHEEIELFLESKSLVDTVVDINTEILGPNKVHLYCLLEMSGNTLMSNEEVSEIIDEIKTRLDDGDSIAPTLVDLADRTIRKLGTEIKELEKQVKAEFPEIDKIDFEVH